MEEGLNRLAPARISGLGWLALICLIVAVPLLATAEDAGHPHGSIRVSEPAWKYPEMAHIAFDTATKIATRAVPGEVLEMGLDDDDGFLVYEVKIATPEHELMEVAVDAGTGEVLSTEVDDDED